MALILIFDEDVQSLGTLQEILQKQGYEVATADSIQSALTSADSLHPDLIIYSYISEQADGLSTIKSLKNHPHLASAFYLLLTQPQLLDSQFSLVETQIDDWVFYPIDVDELNRRVSRGLKHSKTSSEKVNSSSPQVQQILDELEFAQKRLIYSEKFSTLGQMISGITHEINNPVSVVKGNVSHVSEYAQDLMDLLELYGEEYPEPSPAIEERIEEIDLEFLLEDLPQVIESMKNGAERIRQLVESLRNIYRVDDSEEKAVDIHQVLDDIVLILQAKLKGKKGRAINLVKDYGKLPEVKCYPGQLNQVFMNLLNNAIDALEDKRLETSEDEPTIWIKTEVVSPENSNTSTVEQVLIRIKDNGTGIPEDVQTHIFEPFFTTKPLESGTGFGLNICHQIVVETHQGQLECVSQPGEGTELIVSLPLT
ncbi:ATP-binding protein [Capilliphycus salinus ALCB114379]|uniref:ATP-binding protein n=1 Tax=Capilliphycus salinus TaxID=2768948 RepID=UPI0039A61C6F